MIVSRLHRESDFVTDMEIVCRLLRYHEIDVHKVVDALQHGDLGAFRQILAYLNVKQTGSSIKRSFQRLLSND